MRWGIVLFWFRDEGTGDSGPLSPKGRDGVQEETALHQSQELDLNAPLLYFFHPEIKMEHYTA